MKQLKYLAYALLFSGFVFTSCESEVELDDFNSGEADFTTYVALGNSITSGFMDGTLYKSGQENSFPALLAGSMQAAGGANNFKVPLTNDDLGGLSLGGNMLPGFEQKLVFNGQGPVRLTGTPTNEITQGIAANGPFQNLGVPGAKAIHLLSPTYGDLAGLATATANPFYVRFSQPGESLIQAATSQNPTFFTLWIGNNDVLTYASAGGAVDAVTDPANFQNYYGALLQQLTANGAKGVVATIPNILDLPYFTLVPGNPVPLDAGTAQAVNGSYAPYNGAMMQFAGFGLISQEEAMMRQISFSAGQNYPVIVDNDLTALVNPANGQPLPKIRQLKPGELLTLPSSSVIGSLADPSNPASVIGVGVPLDDAYSLTANELNEVVNATNAYNQAINSLAGSMNLAVADMNSYFSQVSNTGIFYNGGSYTVDFVTGGLFSLDGIHPTQKGYAVIANEFVDVINSHYNANLPFVDINNYPGVAFP